MIKMELVRDPNGREDDFTVVDIDGEVYAYRETEFVLDINTNENKRLIVPVVKSATMGD
tara:strand:+ start:76 stop:252 length:177 start_codon:yes stop_codon:yes gene_type:complete